MKEAMIFVIGIIICGHCDLMQFKCYQLFLAIFTALYKTKKRQNTHTD